MRYSGVSDGCCATLSTNVSYPARSASASRNVKTYIVELSAKTSSDSRVSLDRHCATSIRPLAEYLLRPSGCGADCGYRQTVCGGEPFSVLCSAVELSQKTPLWRNMDALLDVF